MSATPDQSRTLGGRAKLIGAAKTAVSIVAFALVLRSIDLPDVLTRFSEADPRWMLAALGALLVHLVVAVWRWNFVLVYFYGRHLGARSLTLVYGLGEALGPILPSFVGSDLVRTFALAGSAPLSIIGKAVALDRVIGMVALLVLIVLSVPAFALLVSSGPALLAVATIGIGGLAAYLIALAAGPLLGRLPIVGRQLASVMADLRRVSYDLRAMVVLVPSGLLVHVSSVAIFWCAIQMLHGSVSFLLCLLIMPTAMLIASAPISLGGWGVREGTLAAGFALVGIDPEVIVAASVCFGLSGIATGLIGLGLYPFLPPSKATNHG